MNNYIAPWHIFTIFRSAPTMNNEYTTPEIYYS